MEGKSVSGGEKWNTRYKDLEKGKSLVCFNNPKNDHVASAEYSVLS